MTRLRFVVLSGCAFALAGCHTVDAIRRITRPSPVTAVQVEPSRGRLAWRAEYREPVGDRDPILHAIFVRGVTKRGTLDVDPDTTCMASQLPVPRACEARLELRLSENSRAPIVEAIVVKNSSGEPVSEVVFPPERPARDPRRWGWLLVAPVLDAATLALSVPVAGMAIVFESLVVALGPLKIQDIGLPVLLITTTAPDGATKDRALGYVESQGRLYVAANHWPRAWYHRARENPKVRITRNGEITDHLAVPVSGEELDRIRVEYRMPTVVRFLTGFPPRAFLRLDPR